MSDPSSPFNWLTFLLGFAIALWLAIVVLFALPDDEPETPVAERPASPGQIAARPIRKPIKPMWIREGDEPMFCTNTDAGGGYVEDGGGGYVDDGGGGYVDDGGGGYVDDGAPRSPAPSKKHAGVFRATNTYHCETNDGGGGYVEDHTGRSVTQPMPMDPRYLCWKDPLLNAAVLRSEGTGSDTTFIRINLNRKGRVVLYDEVTPAAGTISRLPADTEVSPGYLYCMVAESDSAPTILNAAGECKDDGCASPDGPADGGDDS